LAETAIHVKPMMAVMAVQGIIVLREPMRSARRPGNCSASRLDGRRVCELGGWAYWAPEEGPGVEEND